MPNDNPSHLTGTYDPNAAGHSIVETHDEDERPQGIRPGLVGAPTITVTHLRVEDYPEGIPTDLPLTAVNLYVDLDKVEHPGLFLRQAAEDLHYASLAILDGLRMLREGK